VRKEVVVIAVTDTGVVRMRVSKAVGVQDGEFNAHFMVLDELDGDRHLVIPVCQAQAFDLAASLQGWQLGRPLTYQFTAALVRGLDGRVVDVTLDRIVLEVAYAATVKVEGPQRTALVDARASDALNLAVLTDAPVFAAPDVLAYCTGRQAGDSAEATLMRRAVTAHPVTIGRVDRREDACE
jgi:bifunctional DNase/RNase